MDDIPIYRIVKKDELPPIDNITADYFNCADKVSLVDTVTAGIAAQKTTVSLIYDNLFLYALYECEENLPLAVYRNHDDPLYEENVVEVFIDTIGNGSVYSEFQVNPLNARFDAIIINDFGTNGARRGKRYQAFTEWNPSSFDSRSFVSNNQWRVVLKIGFADLFLGRGNVTAPEMGEKWRINLLRVDFDGDSQKYYSWSPNFVPDFHCTNRFGILQF